MKSIKTANLIYKSNNFFTIFNKNDGIIRIDLKDKLQDLLLSFGYTNHISAQKILNIKGEAIVSGRVSRFAVEPGNCPSYLYDASKDCISQA